MTLQTYDVLEPIETYGTQYAQGSTVVLDDADANTTALINANVIVLSSAGNAASELSTDEADTAAAIAAPGNADAGQ